MLLSAGQNGSYKKWAKFLLDRLFWSAVALSVAMGLIEVVRQRRDSAYVSSVAWAVVNSANAQDNISRVIALRDYLRKHITYEGAPVNNRPFLRATAAETLQTGKGYCGEVTRTFIRLSAAVGIQAQRINLTGEKMHVVAEAELSRGKNVIVDSQNPPQIQELENLDRVILRPEYDDYSTLNLRRLRLNWLVSRIKLKMGRLTFWTENPHALRALLWFSIGVTLLLGKALLICGGFFARCYLTRNGWFRVSSRSNGLPQKSDSTVGLEPALPESKLSKWQSELICPGCHGSLHLVKNNFDFHTACGFTCSNCQEPYPVIDGIPRMMNPRLLHAMATAKNARADSAENLQIKTAESFSYEWRHFPEMRAEWESNFWDYMAPHEPGAFDGKRVMDAGCGNGRHAYYAARNGAEVWAVDLGAAIEVARRNTAGMKSVYVIQADLQNLPFKFESFDFIYSIGVLHHLENPEEAFRNLLKYLKPGGIVHIYLYWRPEDQPVKRTLLSLVAFIRKITTRLPHRALYVLSYPTAAVAHVMFIWPYRILKVLRLRSIAERLPMRQYARYPFRVCVNDQFDRFSAPIEFRYTRSEVLKLFERAGLQQIAVRPNFGWCATGQKPLPSNAQANVDTLEPIIGLPQVI
jgi:SAM-dependent methyltransferase/uncharacterized protein YbaR (Trm112 family)